jgi:hypothetical protein
VDHTAAFTQSDIDKPPNWESMTEKENQRSGVYLYLPKGFKATWEASQTQEITLQFETITRKLVSTPEGQVCTS